jgi:hypothetical protein
MENAVPRASPAMARAVPQARRAVMGTAARRANCAVGAGAAGSTRPEALLVEVLSVNRRRMACLVLLAKSRTRMGRGVT